MDLIDEIQTFNRELNDTQEGERKFESYQLTFQNNLIRNIDFHTNFFSVFHICLFLFQS